MKKHFRPLILIAVLLGAHLGTAQLPILYDPTFFAPWGFNTCPNFYHPFENYTYGYNVALETVVHNNNKITVLNVEGPPQQHQAYLTRFTEYGIVDSTYGLNGQAGLDSVMIAGWDTYAAKNFALHAYDDGAVLMLLNSVTGNKTILARVTNEGVLDGQFGTAGVVFSDGQNFKKASTLRVDAEGRILVGGDEGKVWRYTAQGQPDMSYGVGGVVQLHNTGNDVVFQKFLPLSDGGTIVYLRRKSMTTDSSFLYRLLPNGNKDLGFGINGSRYIGKHLADQVFALDDQERILVGGIILYRYLPNGLPDPDFTVLTFSTWPGENGGLFKAYGIVPLANGQILLAGTYKLNDSPYYGNDQALVRLNSDGTLDETFDNYGTSPTLVVLGDGQIFSLTSANGGKVVITNYRLGISRVARLKFNGSVPVFSPEDEPGVELRISPNPVTNRFLTLNYSVTSQDEMALYLLDGQGRTLLTRTEKPALWGENQLSIELPSSVVSGAYYLVCRGRDFQRVLPVVVNN